MVINTVNLHTLTELSLTNKGIIIEILDNSITKSHQNHVQYFLDQ